MKTAVPITVYDLECTAKDAKDGFAKYGKITVWYDDATDAFFYKVGNVNADRKDIIELLGGPKNVQ